MADANPHHTLLSAGADMHLIKNTVQATQADTNTIKAPSAACCTCKSALGQTTSLLYHNWHNLQQFSTTTSTVSSKTVAMFEGFVVGGVWRLGAWEWRLALVGLGKVLLLGYQTSF
jgi:hypothetical protein